MFCRQLALFLLIFPAASCSLVFSEAPGLADVDAGEEEVDGDVPSIPDGTFEFRIGFGGDFASIESWESARRGDLTRRQELVVVVRQDSFDNGEDVRVSRSGCNGIVRAATQNEAVTDRLFLDLVDGSPPCVVGDILLSTSGAEVEVLVAGQVGLRERAIVLQSLSELEAPLLLDGFDADAEYFLEFVADPDAPHNGRPGAGVTISAFDGAPGDGLVVNSEFTVVRGFEVTNWSPSSSVGAAFKGVRVNAQHVLLDQMLVHTVGAPVSDSNSDGIYSDRQGVDLTVRNSFVYNIDRSAILLQSTGAELAQLHLENVSVANCMQTDLNVGSFGCVSFSVVNNGLLDAVNTLVFSPATAQHQNFFIDGASSGSSFDPACTSNASSDLSTPGSAPVPAVADEFVSIAPGNEDLHLRDQGSVLATSGSPLSEFSEDIDGDTRGQIWSIGADQP